MGCSGIGPQGYDPLVCFNCLLIGQWHPEAGACPQLRLDFMLCCGLDLFAPVPDATTHCSFRNSR
ncbi:MAG: transposase [Rhodobacteraceae bacterium]|nr:transposase [Paracoccaceae bacterium]